MQMNSARHGRIQGWYATDMDQKARFMDHKPGEQYALFRRPDNGELSTSRNCTCADVMTMRSGSEVDMMIMMDKDRDELCGYQVGL